ncbi:LLM class flavin-dependent oxidoreductase [Pseudarthrobacter cellobiosi]|uniref:LLM class flavin-dependent oxidoreductase n=1 Tax=Pseudarthrobacter cellobiosi TaxID=2953654 RepID=UPI0027E22A8B|nr:LLM class flavin-dependent oxidoreductase [Pseudarthrobacter sp. HLT1-5]
MSAAAQGDHRARQPADQAGLKFLGLGEHHRRDFALSAPEIVMAAIAREATNFRLSTASTVLSTQDPVRLFEQIATLGLISDGRAEIIAGRGAFIESYPLFGHNTDDYAMPAVNREIGTAAPA